MAWVGESSGWNGVGQGKSSGWQGFRGECSVVGGREQGGGGVS